MSTIIHKILLLKRIVHYGPLMALLVIFTCSFTATVDCLLWTWTPTTPMGKINLLVFATWVLLILRHFFNAILIGPGLVPKGWAPRDEKDEKFMQWCEKCEGYKPLRAHHCRQCKRCVMKMDHHCPWVNNCVGHRNHTSFLLFLFFVPVGCLHALVIFGVTLYNFMFSPHRFHHMRASKVLFSPNAMFLNIVAVGLAIGTIVAVGCLFLDQLRNVLANRTGIEKWIVEKSEDRTLGPEEEPFVYPYDFGWKENLSMVVNWRLTPRGDGVNWEVTPGCHRYALSIEQLKQKRDKFRHTVVYEATSPYSGRWFPCSKGCRTCCCVPCTDEPRVAVTTGDVMLVTRGVTHWLYGEVREGGRKGWFPRKCAARVGKLRDLADEFQSKKDK